MIQLLVGLKLSSEEDDISCRLLQMNLEVREGERHGIQIGTTKPARGLR
jgi:hypothetical protein